MRESRKGNPPKTFGQCGWGRRNPEEQISPVDGGESSMPGFSLPLAHNARAPAQERFAHPHTFPMGTSAELAERFMSSRGACRGRWHWSCDDLRAPHIILPYQASLCPMEPVARSQEWLWLSFGGEMGLFWKWKVIQHYPNVSWGWEVRQAPPGKPHLGKVSPAWLDKHEKNGKQRQAGMESPLRTSSHPILCIGFITS